MLQDKGIFEIAERGEIEVKGKGLMRTYFLLKNLQKSDEQIMGLVDGETCVYQEDLEDVMDVQNGEKTLSMSIYIYIYIYIYKYILLSNSFVWPFMLTKDPFIW